MNGKHFYTISVFINITFLCSCATDVFNIKKVDVNGMIYDFANRPISFCEITLDGFYAGSTDINGRFTMSRIKPGTYIITGQKAGYETYQDTIAISDPGQIVYIRIPSQNQLLNLADEALTVMNLAIADEYIQRAYEIDNTNIEMLFYYATLKFRQQKYEEAIAFLETAKELGSRDAYIDKFLTILKELKNNEND